MSVVNFEFWVRGCGEGRTSGRVKVVIFKHVEAQREKRRISSLYPPYVIIIPGLPHRILSPSFLVLCQGTEARPKDPGQRGGFRVYGLGSWDFFLGWGL